MRYTVVLLTIAALGCGVGSPWKEGYALLDGDKEYVNRKTMIPLEVGAIQHPTMIDRETLAAAVTAQTDWKLGYFKARHALRERDILTAWDELDKMAADVKIMKAAELKVTTVTLPVGNQITIPKGSTVTLGADTRVLAPPDGGKK